MDNDTAEAIIKDFAEHKDGIEALLVHCGMGKNRGPAVAIALNESFGLDHNTEELKQRYPKSNWCVYEKLLEAAQRCKL